MSTLASVPTSRSLLRACLGQCLGTHTPPSASYPDPWAVLKTRYLPLIDAWLGGYQCGAGPAVRNLRPEDILGPLFERFRSFRPNDLQQPGSFRAWLRTVVRSVVVDTYRTSTKGVWSAATPFDEQTYIRRADVLVDMIDAEELDRLFTDVLDDYCGELVAPWQGAVVRRWAAMKRAEAGLDSFAITEAGATGRYRDIARLHGVKESQVYAFTRTVPAEVLSRLRRATAEYDRFADDAWGASDEHS